MTTIDKLSIQGIRSFGAQADDCQVIQFSSPITLILGDNGCGKTTIIECLKYALTGDFPPGSDRGKSFVHDPKIFSLGTTMAQIKLQVKNLKDESLTVCRSMKISHKGGGNDKGSFQTMDSTVSYPGESMSNRVADVDGTMCQFMGVSKAIINNVLFCHQEDSNWPLDEAKKLKEKFDAIFGITEYNKAIERVIKLSKVESEALKVKEADLRFLAHLKQEMEDKTVALKQSEDKRSAVELKCTQCDDEVKPFKNRLLEIHKIECEMSKFQARQVKIDTELKNYGERINELGKKLKKPFEGTLSELEEELKTFGHRMAAKQLERHNLDEELGRLVAEHAKLQALYMEYDKKLDTQMQQRKNEQECCLKRDDKIKRLCGTYDITHSTNLMQDRSKLPEILGKLQQAMTREQEHISNLSKQFDQEEQQHQSDIDKLRIESTKIQENKKTLAKQKQQNEKEFEELNIKINSIENTAQQLNRITSELKRIEDMHNQLTAKFNQEGMRQEIGDSKTKIQELQSQFHQLDERLTFLNSVSKQMAEISLKEKEHEKKEQEVRRVKSKHNDNFKKIFRTDVSTNYRRKLQDVYEKLRREISTLNEQSNALKLKEQSHEIDRKNLKEEITRLEREFDDAKEKIYEQCHNTPYEELLAKCNVAISKHQLEFGALRSAEAMYKKYINKIEDEPCCPLCHNSMNQLEASKLTADLSDEIHKLPENIARAEKALKAEQTRHTNLVKLKSDIEKVAHLEVHIPERKKKLLKLQAELADFGNEQESLQLMLAEPTINLDLANAMFGDMSLLDEAMKEVTCLAADIAKLKDKLPSNVNNGESIETLQAEKSNVNKKLEEERQFLDSRQKDYEKTMDGLNKLRDKKNSLKDQQISLQEGIQSLPQLKERRSELEELAITATVDLQELEAKIEPLKRQLATAISDKEQHKKASRAKLNTLQAKYDTNKNINQDIKRLHAEVMDYEKMNLGAEINRLKEQITQNKVDSAEKSKNIKTTTTNLEEIKIECHKQETLERDLKDNRDYKLLQIKEEELQVQKRTLQQQLGDLDFNCVQDEKNQLMKKCDDATIRKGELLGQIGEINGQIKKIRNELDLPQYKNALENYRTECFEVDIKRRLINVLLQDRIGLEWSLMKYHKEKMENINRLIREYWRLIYQGNDIDYIQIKTKDDSTMKTDTSTGDRRRSYDYSVIQSKNNSEIGMRGRCSAGQRVLACLIIRMALAETFGANCGVFALDEPTTNLDHKNIISLCDALNRIVDQRQTQTNFMLIIITHDEQFISTLGKIYSYQRVFRDSNCKSVIRKVDVGYS